MDDLVALPFFLGMYVVLLELASGPGEVIGLQTTLLGAVDRQLEGRLAHWGTD